LSGSVGHHCQLLGTPVPGVGGASLGHRWQQRQRRRQQRGGSRVAGRRGCGGGASATAAATVSLRDEIQGRRRGKDGQRRHRCSACPTTQGWRRTTMRLLSWMSLSFPRRRLRWPRGQSPPPPPPPPPSTLDAVREDHVSGNDVDDNRDGPSIVMVVMSGLLRKRMRRGTWVRWWFMLDSLGGVHYLRHPPPPPGSSSGSKPLSR
jgi:hypothetical protein